MGARRRWLSMMLALALLASCRTAEQASPTPSGGETSAPPRASSAAAGATATLASATPRPTATISSTATASATPSATVAATPTPTAASSSLAWGYPISTPGQPPGAGFFIRHGYAVENTWFNPGDLHTGEDWYAQQGDTAGAQVLAAAAGEVVYAGSNYPGRVVIVQHAPELFSMYGHLDPALAVATGQRVQRGELLGTVLRRGDSVPNHLHFEIRTFLTTPEVNGDRPRYGYRCGSGCVPGPGYWPLDAPELPGALGWLNPTHVINRRMLPELDRGGRGEVVVASAPVSTSVALWSGFADDGTPQGALGEITLAPGTRYPLLSVRAGAETPQATSAAAYQLWYRLELPDGRTGWIEAAVPTAFETGSDGRPATVEFNVFPAGAVP